MKTRSTRERSTTAAIGSRCYVVAVLLLSVSASTFGWGGPSHSRLAGNIFNDPIISGFATEFNVDVSAVTSWTSEPPTDWHHPGWSMVKARGYLGTYNGMDWTSLTETTRLRYLTHILMDAGVPVGHSPANQVYVNTFNESILEAQASTWSDSPNISGSSFTGTRSSVNNTFESQCVSNASAFKNTRNWLGLHSVDDNRHHGWIGQTLALKMSRAVLTDYFLAKRDTVADIAQNVLFVQSNGNVTLSAAGSQDPDSITWNSNATYYNNGGGISLVEWDFNEDLVFGLPSGSLDTTVSYAQYFGGNTEAGKNISVKVTDDEGKSKIKTEFVKIFTDPVANAGAVYATVKRNQKLHLQASGSDLDGGSITSYAWDIDGDGQYDDAVGANPVLTYDQLTNMGLSAGSSYNVSVRATDNDGAYAGTDTDTFVLTMDTYYSVAPLATVTVDSVYDPNQMEIYGPQNVIDGAYTGATADGSYWASNGSTDPHWVTLEWDQDILLDTVKVFSRPNWAIVDFQIQIWDGDSWVTIDTVNDNTLTTYSFESSSVYETDALRIYITDPSLSDNYARVVEVQVYLADGAQPIPEPATLAMLALGGAVSLRRRRRR